MAPSLRQKAQFYRQLYTGYKSGLQLDQMLRSDFLPMPYAKSGEQLGRSLRSGKTLAGSLLATKIIASWEAQLLAFGEANGRLEEVLGDLAVFYEDRSRQLGSLKAKLVYPFMVFLVSILVQPLPRVAAGTLSASAYIVGVIVRLLLAYLVYTLAFVMPFERASSSAFNPALVGAMRFAGSNHWLRLQYEIAYLNLLTLCLQSGLDVAASLKLLRETAANATFRQRHTAALKLVEKTGASLTSALDRSGLIKHPMVLGFLHSNEASGTLHSDLRKFVLRMKEDTARTAIHFVKQVGFTLYMLGLGVLLYGYL